MTPGGRARPQRRLRAALVAFGLLVAGVAFAAGLAALTTRIATPEIGLRGIPTVGEVAPASPERGGVSPSRSPSVPSTTTPSTTTPSVEDSSDATTAPEAEDAPETEEEDSGRGRGRGRGRSDDEDDD